MGAAIRTRQGRMGRQNVQSEPHLLDLRHAASSSHPGFPQNLSSCVFQQSLLHLSKAQWERPSIPGIPLANDYYCD
jgi:hypothetical protein